MSTRQQYEPGPATGAEVRKTGELWTLVLVRDLAHPPEMVWNALIDPAQLREWAPFDADRNLGTPGTARLSTVGTPQPHITETTITRADAPSVLEFNWGGQALRWELKPVKRGTRLTLWHNIDRNFIAMGAAGWHVCFDVLQQLLDGHPVGRLVGPPVMKLHGWQRLQREYEEQFEEDRTAGGPEDRRTGGPMTANTGRAGRSGETGKSESSSASASERISRRIAELGDWRGKTLARMRALIKAADPDVVEEWKWMGTPVWSHDGIICTGESYKSVVKLTFAKGASLKDPRGLFNSSLDGKVRRAIDIREGESVDEVAFKALVREAIAANGSARSKKRPDRKKPDQGLVHGA